MIKTASTTELASPIAQKDNLGDIEYGPNQLRLINLIILMILLLFICLTLFIDGIRYLLYYENPHQYSEFRLIKQLVLGFIGILVAGYTGLLLTIDYFRQRPRIIISSLGFLVQSSMNGTDFIPWVNCTPFKISTIAGKEFVFINTDIIKNNAQINKINTSISAYFYDTDADRLFFELASRRALALGEAAPTLESCKTIIDQSSPYWSQSRKWLVIFLNTITLVTLVYLFYIKIYKAIVFHP